MCKLGEGSLQKRCSIGNDFRDGILTEGPLRNAHLKAPAASAIASTR